MDDRKCLVRLAYAILDEQVSMESAMASLADFNFHEESGESQIIHLLYHFLNDKDIRDKDALYSEAQKENIINALNVIE